MIEFNQDETHKTSLHNPFEKELKVSERAEGGGQEVPDSFPICL